MDYAAINKPEPNALTVFPNLPSVDEARNGFHWEDLYSELDWLPGGYLNKAHECIDRHCKGQRSDKIALIWEGKNGEEEHYTFAQMRDESNKFANVLTTLGIT